MKLRLSIKQVAIGLLAVVSLSAGYATSSVLAQESDDAMERITLSPSSRQIKAAAGSVLGGTMKIINSGDVAYDFTVYARPYSVSNENYDPNFTDSKPNADLYKWVQFQQTKYSVEPGQSVEVPYVIQIPSGAAPGGHYGVLFAETQEQEVGSTGVARQKRVGKIIYATVNGEFRTSGELKEFILPSWQRQAPVTSSARIANTGNTDFEAKVSTVAKDLFGRVKFRYTGDPIVLPETTRLIEMKWENAPSFGLFNVTQKVEFLDQKHENSGYLLIAPIWFPILLVGLILLGGIYAVLKRRNNRR